MLRISDARGSIRGLISHSLAPMKASTTLALATLSGLLAIAGSAQGNGFTQGNLVVLRIGDGTSSLTNSSTAEFLDEYTPAGVFVQTIALPIAASGTNNPITNSATATSEGYLNLSINGQYLTHAGYGVAPGLVAIASTSSATAPRVVSRVDMQGNVDTSTLLNGDTSYSGNNIRSAITQDGNEFWTAGTALGTADAGVRYIATLGANTSTQLSNTVTNTRVINAFQGQLYTSSASGNFKGVNVVGMGLPTTAGQQITLLPGFPSTSPSQYDYWFADANTLYVGEDGSNGATGGVEKWTQSGGTWTKVYTLAPGAPLGCRSVTGSVNGSGVATIYATTTETSSNQIMMVVDTGAASTFTSLVTAPANEVIRGMRLLNNNGSPGTDLCIPGVGGTLACPCGNPQVPANSVRGCNNSANTGGAQLTSTGSASLTSDTATFTSSGEKPTASSILLQGQLPAGTGVKFGQGVRCITQVLKRLYVHNAVAGVVAFPQGGDPSVHVQSAAKGDTIAAGTTRLYAVYYRDPTVLGSCTQLVDTFNISQTQAVVWAP